MMKGLLHSKRFKENLRKWLFMYAGVMLLLTTVITYSKYISTLNFDDTARASKFNLRIKKVSCSSNEYNLLDYTLCDSNNGNCRPTQPIASCIEVDATGLEVDSELYLTFDPALKNGKFYIDLEDDISNTKREEIQTNNDSTKLFTINQISYLKDGEIINVGETTSLLDNEWKKLSFINSTERIKIGKKVMANDSNTNKKWIFRIVTTRDMSDYATDENGGYVITKKPDNSDIVKVGYVMQQITQN